LLDVDPSPGLPDEAEDVLEKTQVNPWEWQDRLRFSQAWKVDGAQSLVFLSGQAPITPEGELLEGGFEAQARQVLENLGAVMARAGAGFESVVKLTVFLTDISKHRDYEGYAKLSLKKYRPMVARNEDRNVLSGLL
jgi:enamine deaminase RidA (YjgF/YER057c/UK114 family)